MISFPRLGNVVTFVFAIVVLFYASSTALGGDVDDKDFSLRFPAALSRFATYGDVAAIGGASAGSKWSSSTNPASTCWQEDPPRKLSVCGQYSLLDFQQGTNFCVTSESVTVDTGIPGFFTGSAAQVVTNRETMSDGTGFYFAGDLDQLLWSKKLSKDWAVGSAFTYTKSVARMYLGSMEVVKSNSDSYGIRGGVLNRVADNLLAGLVIDYGWSSDRTSMVPDVRLCDYTRQLLVRPGVSYDYMKNGTVYLDYQFGTFYNDMGRLNVHRICGGVDHGFTDWLFVRAGTTIDPSFGAASWTCGVGFYPASWFSLDVGYQYDMFPEIKSEFGRGQTFTVSIAFTY